MGIWVREAVYLIVLFSFKVITGTADAAAGAASGIGPLTALYIIGVLIWFAIQMPRIGRSRLWALGVLIPIYNLLLLDKIARAVTQERSPRAVPAR